MRVGRTVAVTALVLSLVVLTPATAAASPSAAAPLPGMGVSAATDPTFSPSPNKWRAWMINTLSSVLGAATPSKWRAEQLANQHRYNHSWEDWERTFNIDGIRYDDAGNMVGVRRSTTGTGTYVDVAIAGLEASFNTRSAKGGTGGKPFAIPAVKPAGFIKTAGGVLAVYTAFEVGTYIGAQGTNIVGGFFGFDAQGVVCGQTADGGVLSGAVRFVSGQDCSMWDFVPEYIANGDVGPTYAPASFGGHTVAYLGSIDRPTGGPLACYQRTGSPLGAGLAYRFHNSGVEVVGTSLGFMSGTGPHTTCIGGFPATTNANNTGTGAPVIVQIVQSLPGGGYEVKATMAEVFGDPDRFIDCKVTYTDGSSQTSTGQAYKETDGAVAPPICPPTPAGKTPASVAMYERQAGVPGPGTKVSDQPITDEAQDAWADYPECQTGACQLELHRLWPAPRVSCFDLEEGCVGWWEDPSKATNYECTYGTHTVDIGECAIYAGLFTAGRVATGSPYSDPTTGTWSGGQNAPKSGQNAMGASLQDPENPRSCDFPDFALDPVSWVLTPVNCALERNFVPRPTVVETQFAAAGEAWEGKPPAVIATAAASWGLTPEASGCSRSATLFGISFDVLNTCSGPMAAIAEISRWITSAGMVVLVIVLLRRQIAGMVGYNQGQG